jgi:hypothetical protein
MDRLSVSTFRKRLLRRGRALLRNAAGTGPAQPLAGLDVRERDELGRIHSALDRIERGIYGRCECCSRLVEIDRLERTPWELSCAACAGLPAQVAALA